MYDIYQFARLAGYSKETIAAAKGHCTQNGGDNDCEKGLPDACCYEVCPEKQCGASCMKSKDREGKNCPDYREVSTNADNRKVS